MSDERKGSNNGEKVSVQDEFGVLHLERQKLISGGYETKGQEELISSQFLGLIARNENAVGIGITARNLGGTHLQVLVSSCSDAELEKTSSTVLENLGLFRQAVTGVSTSAEIITIEDGNSEDLPAWYIENFNKKPKQTNGIEDFITEMRFPGDDKGLIPVGLILIE